MAKISALPPATLPANDDLFPIVQAGVTRGASFYAFAAGLLPLLPEGFKGDPGAAGNVAASLVQLKAAPLTMKTMLWDGSPFQWETQNAPYIADEDAEFITIVESDHEPLSVGAWKRQSADQVAAKRAGALASRTVLQRLDDQPVAITEFYSNSDGGDYAPAVKRAIDAGVARLVFPPRSTPYEISSSVTAVLTPNTRIDFNGQILQVNEGGKIKLTGTTIATGRTLASNAARYATQIVLNSVSGIEAGDILHINTSIKPLVGWNDTKQDCLTVRSVDAGTATVTLTEPLRFPYATGDAGLSITVYRAPASVILNQPNLFLPVADSSPTVVEAIMLEGLRNITVDGAVMKGTMPFDRANNIRRRGIQIYRCQGVDIRGTYAECMGYTYSIGGGTRNIQERSVSGRYNHHTNADVANFSSGYLLDGMNTSDNYQGLNVHPCFDAWARNVTIDNDTGLSPWRTFGGGLENVRMRTSSGDTELPQGHGQTVNAGFEYLYLDADFTVKNLEIKAPNRSTLPDFAVTNGRRVYLEGVKVKLLAASLAARDQVAKLVIGPGCEFGEAKTPTPPLSLDIRCPVEVQVPQSLNAYLDSGVYHIDPRKRLVAHDNGFLRVSGKIGNFTGATSANVDIPIRIHTNVFSDQAQANDVAIELKVICAVRHGSGAAFDNIAKVWRWYFKVSATSYFGFKADAVQSDTAGGQGTTTLTVAQPGSNAFAGVTQLGANADHHVNAIVTVNCTSLNPNYSLDYELTLRRMA